MIRFFFNFAMFFIAAIGPSVLPFQPTVNHSNIKPYGYSNGFRPELPAAEIFVFPCSRKINLGNEFMTSPSYMKIRYKYRRPTDNPGYIVGHLLYLQKEFHIDYLPNRM